MSTIQTMLFGSESNHEIVAALSLDERIQRAANLLRENEPEEGYYGAFSGGKDSCAIKALAVLAGVKVEWFYNNTTIDPPELVRFIKQFHPDVKWNQPKHGNMLHRIATAPKVAPTRKGRWCCDEYKEGGGRGRIKIFGVRAAESKGRRHNWREFIQDRFGDPTCCPVVFWTTENVWEFIRSQGVPYCKLYDEGWDRLGCVGCPLASRSHQMREFERWPKYLIAWKKAVVANWEKWHAVPNTKTGEPRYQAKFSSGEEYWQWWLNYKAPDVFREDCQGVILWTNVDEETADSSVSNHSEIRRENARVKVIAKWRRVKKEQGTH